MIIFQTDLLPTNPAYNDSIIKYYSSITGMTKSEITIGQDVFTIYPFNQIFSFNFKDIAKVLINPNGFADSIVPDLQSEFIYPDDSLQLTISPAIKVFNAVSAETESFNYTFSKNVEQLPNYVNRLMAQSDVTVLLPSINAFDYEVTYFEGYPYDFGIRGLKSGDTFYFKNSNTGMVSNTFTSNDDHVKRIFLSDGATNETLSQVLLMLTTVNPIELYVNDIIKANIRIKRLESNCGVYLKWFNQYGSYSYWLFEQVFKENFSVKEIDEMAGKWDNLYNLTSTSESFGKTAKQSLELTTNFQKEEKDYLVDIIKSPKVEMYINQIPFIQTDPYSFVGVSAGDGTYSFSNKTSLNKLKVTLEMPAYNSITY